MYLLNKYRELKNKFHNYLNKYSLLNDKFEKIYDKYEEYKDYSETLEIQLQQIGVQLRETQRERDEYKEERDKAKKKLLTDTQSEYTLDIPKLNIKQIETALKSCEPFLLSTIRELIRLDTWEIIKSLANALQEQSKYEISIALNAIRRRNEAWLGMLDKAIERKTMYADKLEGKMKPTKK